MFQTQNCTMKAMSIKKRQQKFRERRDSDPFERAEFLAKRREKYVSDLKEGKRKNVDQHIGREKRSARRRWKTTKREYRTRKNLFGSPSSLTAPNSSSGCVPIHEAHGPSSQKMSGDRKKRSML